MNTRTRIFVVWLVVICALTAYGQTTPVKLPQNVEEHRLNSKLMAREISYRVIIPQNYRTANETMRYPVVYLLHGLNGHFDNWTDRTGLVNYASAYKIIIVTPEGGDGWYTDSVSSPNDRYESYIVKELIPEIDKNYRTIPDRAHRAIAGLSMGGYGSIKFGLKYPELFVVAGSFSGAVAGTTYTEKTAGAIAKSIDSVYGPLDSEARKTNDIFRLVRELTPEKQKALPFIYLDCGTEDFLFQSNRDFLSLLTEKKIPHEYRELPGVHDWKYWDKQVREFLAVSERFFAAKGT